MQVVILGMHGGGTSLVAALVNEMGVDINPNLRGKVKHYCPYEDVGFMKLNVRIIKAAGGRWLNLPSRQRIDAVSGDFQESIRTLIGTRNGAGSRHKAIRWGWKDPRNCATVHLFHPHLADPHYILVTRNKADIVRSLESRGPSNMSTKMWSALADDYYGRAYSFMRGVDAPKLEIRYESLMLPGVPTAAVNLARFVRSSIPRTVAENALEKQRIRR